MCVACCPFIFSVTYPLKVPLDRAWRLYRLASRLVQTLFWLGFIYAAFILPILIYNPVPCFGPPSYSSSLGLSFRPQWETTLLLSIGTLQGIDQVFRLGLGATRLFVRYRLRSR